MTKANWQLTRGQRLSYSVGMFSTSFITATVMAWILYFYSPPPNKVDEGMVFLGIGVAVGLARLIGSLVDAFTNPLIAFWSDRSTNPNGRRIPFIKRGLLPLVIFAILLWFPPVRGTSHWNVVWLAVTLSGTWFFYTYVVAPYLALMPEITTDPEERVSLTVTMSYWEAGAIVLSAVAIPPVIEALKDGVQLGPLFLEDGYKATAIILAAIGAVGFLISVSRIKERPLDRKKVSTFGLKQSVVECFRNPAFPPYLLAVAAAKIGMGIVLISIPFVATAVLHKGEGFVAVLMIPLFFSTIIGLIVGEAFVNRVGLKAAFRTATGIATGITIAFFAVTFIGGSERPLLSATDDLPHGDLLLVFGEEGTSTTDISTDDPPKFLAEGGLIQVRIPRLVWESLFSTSDLKSFREQVKALAADEVASFLRRDKPELVEQREDEIRGISTIFGQGWDLLKGLFGAERGKSLAIDNDKLKTWVLDQELPALYEHLVPDAAQLLFPDSKRRVGEDKKLYARLPKPLAIAGADGPTVRIPLAVGSLDEPEQTTNLQGWTRILSTHDEREINSDTLGFSEDSPRTLDLDGQLVFSDGSVTFKDFAIAPGSQQLDGANSTRFSEIQSQPAELEALMDRFGLRIEETWSIRIWVIIFLFLLLGFPAAILMSMYRPIVCEIVDLDEQRCGSRREAIYFGVEGLLTKGADGVSAIVAPAVMLLGHWLVKPPFGYMLTFAAAGVFMLLGWWIFRYYPLGQRPDDDA